jgi:putative Mn2+ efflux pump MntP
MIALLLVALALGVDNLAVSLGIGVSGVHGAMRVRVAVIFGLFEAGMPLLGMAAGRAVAGDLGGAAPWLGGGLLAAVGVYQLCASLGGQHQPSGPPAVTASRRRIRLAGRVPRNHGDPPQLTGSLEAPLADARFASRAAPGRWGTGRLLVSGLAMSIDNLVVGFALGAYHVSIVVAALVIGVVSVAMALAGLELGARIGAALGERGELAGAAVLIAVGVVMAAGLL